MKICILGSSGFLGWHIAESLVECEGLSVTRVPGRFVGDHQISVEGIVSGNCSLDWKDFDLIVVSVGAVRREFDKNISLFTGIGKALELAELTEKTMVVWFGSAAEYGRPAISVDESSELNASTPYGISKISCYDYVSRLFQPVSRARSVYLRIFNILSDRDRPAVGSLQASLIGQKWSHNVGIKLSGSDSTRDFCVTSDLARVLLRLVDARDVPSVLNFCSGKPLTISELVESVAIELGLIQTIHFSERFKNGDIAFGSNERLIQCIGRYQFVDPIKALAVGIERTR